MAKTRINWGSIGFTCFIGCFFGLMGLKIHNDTQQMAAEEEVEKASTAAVDSTTYNLVNADIVESHSDELSHIFNFTFGHVTVIGKVNDFSINSAFTFHQFGAHGQIENVRTQGCAIAADAIDKLADSTTENSAVTVNNARLFLQNHCAQGAPRP